MIVDPDMPDHWKVQMLSGLLGDDHAAAVYLIRLWGHCQNRKKDRFDNLPAMALRAICKYQGDADQLEAAMIECGFIERDGSALVVVGWAEHNANLWSAWENGKKGGRPRKPNENPRDNPSDNPRDTSRSPDEVDEVDEVDEKKPRAGALAKPHFLDRQVWNDYRSFRTSKKAKLTPTAWARILAEIERGIAAGINPNDMLAEAMEAGWTGFKLEWYQNRVGKPQAAQSNGPRNLLS